MHTNAAITAEERKSEHSPVFLLEVFWLKRGVKYLQEDFRAVCLVFRSELLQAAFPATGSVRPRSVPGYLTGLRLCVRAAQPNGEISLPLLH